MNKDKKETSKSTKDSRTTNSGYKLSGEQKSGMHNKRKK